MRLSAPCFIGGCCLLLGCGRGRDLDRESRLSWVAQRTAETEAFLRDGLNGTPDIVYEDGWFGVEHDPHGRGAWRWMGKRGIVRFRTRIAPGPATDMELHVFGWVPLDQVGLRTCHLEFAINGHVVARREPQDSKLFEHVITVPRRLLGSEEWVDLSITTANTARPVGDWRDIGFATTGFFWKRAGAT